MNYSPPQQIRYKMLMPTYNQNPINMIPVMHLYNPKIQRNDSYTGIQFQNMQNNNYNQLMNNFKNISNTPYLTKNFSTSFINNQNIQRINLNQLYRTNSPITANSPQNINYNILYNNKNNNNSLYSIIKKDNNPNIFYSPQKIENPNQKLIQNTISQKQLIPRNNIIIQNQNNNINFNLNQQFIINNNNKGKIESIKVLKQNNKINNNNNTQNKDKINNDKINESKNNISIKDNENKNININNNLDKENDEPKESFDPSEFIIIKRIGEGTYGKIYMAQWKKNNKKYAMKKEIIKGSESLKRKKEKSKIVTNFIKKTESEGVIKIFGDLVKKKGNEYYYYVLMEFAEKDWEKELIERQKIKLFYSEKEIFIIMNQLIKTLSLLQKNHITHRDIKPQNVLICNGIYKISDFGEARTLVREGVIVSRVRGTELYMSPILFNGLRLKLTQVSHNTFKSDVFSLGMCIFFASTLTFNSLCDIRELNEMKLIKEQLIKYLSVRYSNKLINILYEMLQVNEDNRPDFISLEKKYFS